LRIGVFFGGAIRISSAKSIETALTNERKTFGKHRQLKTGLMTDLLTGRVRVPEGAEVWRGARAS